MKELYNKITKYLSESPITVLAIFLGLFIISGIIVFLCTPDAHLNIDWHALDFE